MAIFFVFCRFFYINIYFFDFISYNYYGDSMSKLDLSDIKNDDLEKTSSFVDLMSRKERKNHRLEKDEFEEMVEERKRSTKDLTRDLEKVKDEVKNEEKKYKKNEIDDEINKTQILDLTRQMKFNFEEQRKDNNSKKKKGISPLNVIGEVNLLCIGYYIYLLAFTNYQDNKDTYIITGGMIVLLVLLFGLSVVTPKKISKIFKTLNILTIFGFIAFNIITQYI